MAHEQLKKQYAEDCKKHEKPWELWEFRKPFPFHSVWTSIAHEPAWIHNYEYRRKDSIEPVSFQPEYFSGLNWREAQHLIGKAVEASMNGETWSGPFTLKEVCDIPDYLLKFKCCRQQYPYIRTCPETHNHTTITICGTELPRPEIKAPTYGDHVWIWSHDKVAGCIWDGTEQMLTLLNAGIIHLNKARAQAWAEWWTDTILVAIKASNDLS